MFKNLVIGFAFCAFGAFAAPAEELYSNKYDYIDAAAILANDRIRKTYFECFMEIAPCLTPDAAFLKAVLPESLVTKCKKCTEKQKIMFDQIVTYYTEKQPEQWNQILLKAINDSQKKRKN